MKRVFLAILLLLAIAGSAFAWRPLTLIAEKIGAETYRLDVPARNTPGSIILTGTLQSDETIAIERCTGWTEPSSCSAWGTLYIDGSAVTGLTSTNNVVTIYGSMILRVNKPVTDVAAGVIWAQ